ncbi:MAG TPA: GAF domain-containing protein [bacterium]
MKMSQEKLYELFELKERISSATKLSEIMNSSIEEMIKITHMDAGCIYLMDKDGNMSLAAHKGFTPKFLEGVNHMLTGEGITGRVTLTGLPEIVNDVVREPRIARRIVKEKGIHSFVSIPLLTDNRTIGVMNVASFKERRFEKGFEKFLLSIGRTVGNAIYNATLFKRVKGQVNRMMTVNDIGIEISGIFNLSKILEKIPVYFEKLFQVNNYAIVFNHRLKKLRKYKEIKEIRTAGFRKVRLSFLRPSFGRLVFNSESDSPVVIQDCFADGRFPSSPIKSDKTVTLRSLIGAKIKGGLDTYGIVAIGSRSKNAFDENDIRIFKLFLSFLSASIHRAILFGEMKHSYRRLLAAQKLIVRAEKVSTLVRFATQIAHRIRNSLSAMRTALDILNNEEGITGEAKELLEILFSEQIKLNKLVDDFYTFAGPDDKTRTAVNIQQFLNSIIEGFLEHEAHQLKELNILKKYDPRIESISIDTIRFGNAIRNLLENAVDSFSDSGGTIEIGYRLMAKQSNSDKKMEFFVKDNGCGMDSSIRTKILEPFFSTKPKGSGLGLAIVEKIVQQHNGEVVIKTLKGHGTRIRLIIPVI